MAAEASLGALAFGSGGGANPNDHFTKPQPPGPLPWELDYDQRRAISKDPRIRSQADHEAQWKDSIVEVLWTKIRMFALPSKDWLMNAEAFSAFMKAEGLTNEYLIGKLFTIFSNTPVSQGQLVQQQAAQQQHQAYLQQQKELAAATAAAEKNSGIGGSGGVHNNSLAGQQQPMLPPLGPPIGPCVNGLVLCKIWEISLTDSKYQDQFIRHIYNRFDRPCLNENLSRAIIENAKLTSPQEAEKLKKGKKPPNPLTMKQGATYDNLMGLKKIFESVLTEDPEFMTYEEFKKFFLEKENRGFVGTFVVAIMEASALYYSPPRSLPLVPLRWLITTDPVPMCDEMHDADVLLLREFEQNGGDSTRLGTGRKKGKKGGGGTKKAAKK